MGVYCDIHRVSNLILPIVLLLKFSESIQLWANVHVTMWTIMLLPDVHTFISALLLLRVGLDEMELDYEIPKIAVIPTFKFSKSKLSSGGSRV